MRIIVTATAIGMAIVGLSIADDVRASIKQPTNIPAQPLAPAIQALAKDRKFQIVYVSEDIGDRRTSGAVGEYTPEEALQHLLSGTGLTYKYLDDNTITIVAPTSASDSQTVRQSLGDSGGASTQDESKKPGNVPQGGASQPPSVEYRGKEQASQKGSAQLEEVVVTSQKRKERLEDVPVPVTALTATALADHNEYQLQDYYTSVPGLSLTPNQLGGAATIAIRGVTTGDFTNPTVGVTVDDMPFGSSTVLGGGFFVPDLDPTDLERIEVLRGPQGTLYGASSIGGLLKYVTAEPSTDALTGRVQVGLDSTQNSAHAGYNVSGAVNIPLTDTVAMRVSAFTRTDPGYIDNIRSGEPDVNRTEIEGAHLAALWRPSDVFSLNLSALAQDNRLFGSPYATIAPGVGDLQQRLLPGTGYGKRKFYAYSAVAHIKLGPAELVSVTGFSRVDADNGYDRTAALGQSTEIAFPNPSGSGYRSTNATDLTHTDKFTQELRLTVPLGAKLDWLFGGFYTHEYSPWLSNFFATQDNNAIPSGTFGTFDFWSKYAELAAFTNLTFHFTDRFDVQLGGRGSHITQSTGETDSGPFVSLFETNGGPGVLVYPYSADDEHAYTYLLTPELKITPDLMIYARFASGYRPGGSNGLGALAGLPLTFQSDTTRNYEVGIKAKVLDQLLYLDGSVYHIDWQNIQLQLMDPVNGITFFANGSAAKSDGVELSAQTARVAGLSVGGWVALNHAVLTETLGAASPVVGNQGDRLPFSSRFSANLSIDDEFPVGPFTGTVGADLSYVGERFGVFIAKDSNGNPISARQPFPAYAKTDLRTGLKMNDWTLDLYVNNVTDKRGILGGGLGTPDSDAFTVIRPRTIGLTVARKF